MSAATAVIVGGPEVGDVAALPGALASCAAQSRPFSAVLVVTSAGRASTLPHELRSVGVRVIQAPTRTRGATRAYALHTAPGARLLVLDARDRLRRDAHERLAAALDADPRLAYVGGRGAWSTEGDEELPGHGSASGRRGSPAVREARARPSAAFAELLEGHGPGALSCVLLRRAALRDVGAYDPRVGAAADLDFLLRLAREGAALHLDRILADLWPRTADSDRPDQVLSALRRVLRRQENWIRGDASLERARRDGLARWDQRYGRVLRRALRRNLAERRVQEAGRAVAALLVHCPDLLVQGLLERRPFAPSVLAPLGPAPEPPQHPGRALRDEAPRSGDASRR